MFGGGEAVKSLDNRASPVPQSVKISSAALEYSRCPLMKYSILKSAMLYFAVPNTTFVLHLERTVMQGPRLAWRAFGEEVQTNPRFFTS
jgi:hypothetical protein